MTLRDRLDLVRGRSLTLGTLYERLARVHGDAPLVEEDGDDGLRLSYAMAADLTARWAGAIRAKITPGDRVVIAAPNGYALVLLCAAASRAGGVAVPVNPKMRDDETDHVVADSEAAIVVRDTAELDGGAAIEAVHAEPDDVAALFYTSGTTGKPKGAQLTHRALVGQAGRGALFPARLRRDEAVTGMPVAHIAGFSMLIQAAAPGERGGRDPYARVQDEGGRRRGPAGRGRHRWRAGREGPGRHAGLPRRARRHRRGAHGRRLDAHGRPRPPPAPGDGRARGPQEGRDQARRLLGVRSGGGGGARAAPGRRRGRRRRAARRAEGRGAGRGGHPARRSHTHRGGPGGVGRRAAQRLQ